MSVDHTFSAGNPLVSVVIPAYQAAHTIERALASVFCQEYDNIEVIVIDDGSTDATAETVERYGRDEIRLARLPRNMGVCGAMNEGIAMARGEFIAFLDADDEWLPTKLSKQVQALLANPRASFSSCAGTKMYFDGSTSEFGMKPAGVNKDDWWRHLLVATFVAKPCVVARASALAEAGAFDTNLRVAEDQDMWIRLSYHGEVEFVPERLVVVYETQNSLTHVYARRMAEYVLPMIRRRIEALGPALSSHERRHILGERYTNVGRNLYASGQTAEGFALMLRAILAGTRVFENLWYIIVASPPARSIKYWLGLEPRR